MVDKKIKKLLDKHEEELNFKGLINFMEKTGIDFKEHNIKDSIAFATCYSIYIDKKKISLYPSHLIYFIILHEIAHYKRIEKIGKHKMLENLSDENFETFFEHILQEELFADRYAKYLFYLMNKIIYPSSMTQELFKESNQIKYRNVAAKLFGVIKNDENNYKKLIEEILIK